MRHFIGYRADGTLAPLETYSPGGWPVCQCREGCGCLADHTCMMDACVSLRTSRMNRNPDIVGFALYDCPCPSTEEICETGCFNTQFANHYIDIGTKSFVAKPAISMQIDNVGISNEEVVSRPPGNTCVFKLVGPDIPDGAEAYITTSNQVDIVEGPNRFQLFFTNGSTPEVTLYAPSQGAKSRLTISGKYIRPQWLILRGFAV